MRNNKYRAVVVGIGLFAVLAVLVFWAVVNTNKTGVTQDEGAKITTAKDTVFGSILLPEAISHLEADGANGLVTIDADGQLKPLPAGRYYIRYWKTERKDDTGKTWELTGQYYGRDNPFEIKNGQQTKLDIGEPVVATVQARNTGPNYSFNQVIKGRLDEIIGLTCNGSRPQPPKLNIKNKNSSYDQTFDFQYG
jgi:hypothetical protein